MTEKHTKFAWIGMILMALDLFLLDETGLMVTAMGIEEVGMLREMEIGVIAITIIRYIKIAGIVCALYLVLANAVLGKFWYAPMAVAGAVGVIGVLCLLVLKNTIIGMSGMGELMDMLSIKCTVTDAVWVLAATSVVELLCGIIPFVKVNIPFLKKA